MLFYSLGQVVKLCLALAVLFTYGLQYFVPLDIMWTSLKEKCSHKYQGICQTALRVVMVLVTGKTLALTFPIYFKPN